MPAHPTDFDYPVWLVVLAMTARNPTEKECLLSWANAALWWFWPSVYG